MSKQAKKDVISAAKEVVGNRKSSETTFEERVEVSRRMGGLAKRPNESSKEHLARVNAFRCGW